MTSLGDPGDQLGFPPMTPRLTVTARETGSLFLIMGLGSQVPSDPKTWIPHYSGESLLLTLLDDEGLSVWRDGHVFRAGHLCVAYKPLDIRVVGLADGSHRVYIQSCAAGVH